VDQINPYPGQTEHCLFFILGVSLPLSLLIKPTAKTKKAQRVWPAATFEFVH